MAEIPDLGPIKCGETDCEKGRHCFNPRQYRRKDPRHDRAVLEKGACKKCGVQLVDWDRIHQREPKDASHTFQMLRHEYIRWIFWNRRFNKRALTEAYDMGRRQLYGRAREVIARTVGPVARSGWSFKQVPTEDDKITSTIQYAQHATASCCRRCIQGWHAIANDHALTEKEIDYLSALVVKYLAERLPADIPEEAQESDAA